MSECNNITKIRFCHNVYGLDDVNIYLQKPDVETHDKCIKTFKKQSVVLNLSYKEISGYTDLNYISYKLTITSTQNDILLTKNINVIPNNLNLIVISGDILVPNSISILNFKDKKNCSPASFANISIINGLYGSDDINIYFNNNPNPSLTNIKYGHTKNSNVKVGQVAIPGSESLFISIVIKSSVSGNDIYTLPNFYAVNKGSYKFILTGSLSSLPKKSTKDKVKINTITVIIAFDTNDECQILQQNLNVQNYMGKWYQISSIPMTYGINCHHSEANYTLLNNNVIKVINKCYDINWTLLSTIEGEAKPSCNPSALCVAFIGIPITPICPNYLIHKTDYISYAIVGSPSLSSLYILSRTKQMCKQEYDKLIVYCTKLGYDITKLIIDDGSVFFC
jgi:apolipoprotein D and lipocalin family protein